MNKNLLLLLGIIIILIVGWWWFGGPPTENGTDNEIDPGVTELRMNTDLYPLYETVEWKEIETEEVTIGNTILEGVSATSTPIAVESDLSAVFIPFMTHYKTTLEAVGWELVPELDAGGPTGGQSGYEKDGETILVRYQVDFHVQKENAPSDCPCDITLSLFSTTREQGEQDSIALSESLILTLFGEELISECIEDDVDGEYQSCEVDISEEDDGYRVRVIFFGLADDSVRAIRYEGLVVQENDSWSLSGNIAETYLCQDGRGQQEFAPNLCL